MPRYPKTPIDPEVEAMPVSRQRKLQIQNGLLGLCRYCSVPAVYGHSVCARHMVSNRERQRLRQGCVRRNLNSDSYLWEELLR